MWDFVAEAGFEPLSCDLRLMWPAGTTELPYSAVSLAGIEPAAVTLTGFEPV